MVDRMCILTRQVMDEDALIRFVRDPAGQVVPDLARKLPGRGVWVSLSRERLSEAVRKRLFAKAFAAETAVPHDLPGMVGGLLRRQALALLSLSKKAGEAVAGFNKVEEMLGRNRAKILLHAAGASADGCRKLDRMAHPDVKRITLFQSGELDLAFGRSNVIHAAVARGGLAEKLLLGVSRIEMFEALGGPEGPEDRV